MLGASMAMTMSLRMPMLRVVGVSGAERLCVRWSSRRDIVPPRRMRDEAHSATIARATDLEMATGMELPSELAERTRRPYRPPPTYSGETVYLTADTRQAKVRELLNMNELGTAVQVFFGGPTKIDDEVLWRDILQRIADFGNFKRAVKFFNVLKEHHAPGVEEYNIIMEMFSRKKQGAKVMRFRVEMEENGVEPNADTVVFLFRAMKAKGRVEEGFDFIHDYFVKTGTASSTMVNTALPLVSVVKTDVLPTLLDMMKVCKWEANCSSNLVKYMKGLAQRDPARVDTLFHPVSRLLSTDPAWEARWIKLLLLSERRDLVFEHVRNYSNERFELMSDMLRYGRRKDRQLFHGIAVTLGERGITRVDRECNLDSELFHACMNSLLAEGAMNLTTFSRYVNRLDILYVMKTVDKYPNDPGHANLVEALQPRVYDEFVRRRDWLRAARVHRRIAATRLPDVQSLTTLLGNLGERGELDTVYEIVADYINPDHLGYTAEAAAYAWSLCGEAVLRSHRYGELKRLVQGSAPVSVPAHIEVEWDHEEDRANGVVFPDMEMASSLCAIANASGPAAVKRALQATQENGGFPRVGGMGGALVIDALENKKRKASILELEEVMQQLMEVQEDVTGTTNRMALAYADRGMARELRAVVKAMEDAGVDVSPETYQAFDKLEYLEY